MSASSQPMTLTPLQEGAVLQSAAAQAFFAALPTLPLVYQVARTAEPGEGAPRVYTVKSTTQDASEAVAESTFRVMSVHPISHGVRGVMAYQRAQYPFVFTMAPKGVQPSGETQAYFWINGATRTFTLPAAEDARSRRGMTGGASKAGGAGAHQNTLPAPMPGKLLSVLVAVGDVVTPETPVMVMESMKMELTLNAPGAGRVQGIHAQPGELVALGKTLLEIAPSDKP